MLTLILALTLTAAALTAAVCCYEAHRRVREARRNAYLARRAAK